jgi:hypothetical protein
VPTRKFRLYWILLPALLLLQSCDKGGGILSSRPKGVLSKKEMTNIMIDIHLEEAILRSGKRPVIKTDMRSYARSEYLKVFANHGVTPADFNRSLDYYLLHVEDLDEIYTDVISRLEEMEAETQGSKNKPPLTRSVSNPYTTKPVEKKVLTTPSENKKP